ncbi:glycosyltransferase family 9 protein [Cryomorpha ignava]|uniref:Glycosyltransferase family 9 protein n=1 Tax=Cryomorpha ignava TaxID=101383 RepID=A0A7K3WQX6_9FLAO|nr:glycosyltransferase family 9 protein [Cryomorpha ignava]NEN23115.1 glycosyltransferase family 9 protein [Cryomorpha ignava]
MKNILIIQTAFIGDVILATPLIEKLKRFYPESNIDFLLRKGNEGLLKGHPKLNRVLIWDKRKSKYNTLAKITAEIRKNKYDVLINLQRFASSGFLTTSSKAKIKIGFSKNPFSFAFTHKFPHVIDQKMHEVDRNLSLIEHLTDPSFQRPVLYPSTADYEKVGQYQSSPYFCLAPASVWFTKQYPEEKWVKLIDKLNPERKIFLLGAPSDIDLCASIKNKSVHDNVVILAGELTLLQSAALMEGARMNYTNDSAPMHIASAVNAPITAIYCSTIPEFGFGPLSDNSKIIETREKLECRPCGLHGKKACPEGHFKCAYTIDLNQFFEP